MTAHKSSLVHPRYKTKYRVGNWREYERGLRRRGDLTIWFAEAAFAARIPPPNGKRGWQRRYSDLAIEPALTLRLVFHLPLRQTEGSVSSVLDLMGVFLDAPDHTTLSRRGRQLGVKLRACVGNEAIHLIVDSTGLKASGPRPNTEVKEYEASVSCTWA